MATLPRWDWRIFRAMAAIRMSIRVHPYAGAIGAKAAISCRPAQLRRFGQAMFMDAKRKLSRFEACL